MSKTTCNNYAEKLQLYEDLVAAYGVVQKEYVTVPDGLLKGTQELRKLFDQGYAYVGSLKSKPTKKRRC